MILLGGSHLYKCRIHEWMRCKTSITGRNWLPFYRVLAYNEIIAKMSLCIFAVAPRRGAWIEIIISSSSGVIVSVAPRRGAWIEIGRTGYHYGIPHVAPRRGAWIEIAQRS